MVGVDFLLDPQRRTPARPPRLAKVTRSDASGVWCTPEGGDTRAPLGPCRAARYRDHSTCTDAAHSHPLLPLPVGTLVVLASTSEGPWVLSYEEPT